MDCYIHMNRWFVMVCPSKWRVNDKYWFRPNLCNPLLEMVTLYIIEIFSNGTKTTHYSPPFSRSVLWFNAVFITCYLIHNSYVFVWCLFVSLFVSLFVCLPWTFRPTREYFIHMETSTWPMKAFTFWPILSTHSHWGVGLLKRVTPTVTQDIRLYGHLQVGVF